MRTKVASLLAGIFVTTLTAMGAYADATDTNWPTWRGPNSDGVALTGNPPITWSETENIKWKVPMRGGSDSTPIVWGDKMFFQTAFPTDKKFVRKEPPVPYTFNLVCLDRQTGETIWEQTVREEIPHEQHHPHSSLASYSPVTDGELIWASFGTRGLHCYDLDGNHKWSADLVKLEMINGFGEGSSPVLAGDAIVVLADHEGDSKLYSFNKTTGEPNWVIDRDETSSWASPRVVEVDGALQLIVSGKEFSHAYDAATGESIWQCAGLTSGPIPTPVAGFGMAYVATGYMGFSLLAIELGHTGDLTGTDAIKWQLDAGTPYVPSPLLFEDRLYFMEGNRPFLSCYNAKTGEEIYAKVRLDDMRVIYASPTGVGDRIYIADRKGTVMVIKHADEFEVLATNKLDDTFDASPVVVGDDLYLKGDAFLYCISER